MKFRFSFLVFVIISFPSVFLHAQTLQWAAQYGTEDARTIVTDANNNVYFSGSFSDVNDFDPGPGIDTMSAWLLDGFLTKIDNAGNYQWTFKLDQPGNFSQQSINACKMDAGNNVYMACDFSLSEVGVLKLSPSGNELWRERFKYNSSSNTHYNDCNDIALDNSGNSIITGYFYNYLNALNTSLPPWYSNGQADVFIFKIDSTGDFKWGRTFGGSENDKAFSVATDYSGNIYCIGMFKGSVDFDPDTSIAYNLISASPTKADIFIVKYDQNGDFLWVKTLKVNQYFNFPFMPSIEIDNNQDIIISSTGYSGTDLDPGPGVSQIPNAPNGDKAFIVKLNSNGDFIWGKTISGNTFSTNMSLDPSGNILHSGYYSATSIDLDPGPDSAMFYSVGTQGYFLKLNQTGQYLSGGVLNSSINCYPSVIYSGYPQTIFIAGEFRDTLDIDPSTSFSPLINTIGLSDMFLAKYSGCSYISNTINLTSCGPLNYNGQTYNISGTFYQTFPDITGCDSITALNITIHNFPIAEINGSSVLCIGTPGMLESLFPQASYLWSTGDTAGYILINTPGVYSLIVTDNYGCTATDSITVNMQSYPFVSINAQSATTFCQGDSVILAANSALASYQWYRGTHPLPGANTSNFTAKFPGKYRCVAQNSSLCSDTSNIIKVNVPCIYTGPNDDRISKSNETISVYPNPTIGLITVQGYHDKICVYNSMGKLIYISEVSGDLGVIDLSEFPNGLYFIRIFVDNESLVNCISLNK